MIVKTYETIDWSSFREPVKFIFNLDTAASPRIAAALLHLEKTTCVECGNGPILEDLNGEFVAHSRYCRWIESAQPLTEDQILRALRVQIYDN